MSKPLRFTKAEMAAAAKLCRDHGVVVKLGRDGDLFVMPDNRAPPSVDSSDDTDLDAELAAFEARHGND